MSYRPVEETFPFIEVTFGNGQVGGVHFEKVVYYGKNGTGHATIGINSESMMLQDTLETFLPRLREAIELNRPKPLAGFVTEETKAPTEETRSTNRPGKR